MNRKKIISAVQQICDERELAFRVVDRDSLSAHTPALPAAVLVTPEFERIEGRSRGRITYKVEMYLFEKGMHNSPEQQAEQLAQMESIMLDIFTQLSENENVALVDKLQMDAVTSRLLARAEIGLKATAEVVVIF